MSAVAQIEISKKNLLSNIKKFKKLLPRGNKIAGVVKANAYGHGVREVVSIIEKSVDYFQVDDFAELVEIRQYTKKPVLVFGYVDIKEVPDFVRLDAVLGVYDLKIIKAIDIAAKRQNKITKVHVKVDALLGRQGILQGDALEFFRALLAFKNIEVEAVYSHFSNIEDVDDLEHARMQYQTLFEVKEIAKSVGFSKIVHHISATSGFLTDQKNNWDGAILRFGIGMYGLWPSEGLKKRYEKIIDLKPVMRWVTKIVQVKDFPIGFPIGYGCTYVTTRPTKIAVIPQGYSDGYDRGFSNNSAVLVGGTKCPVIGRVAMNMIVADISAVNQAKAGDEVVLLGKQGNAEITAEELAGRIGTINYEIVTRVWPKLERVIV